MFIVVPKTFVVKSESVYKKLSENDLEHFCNDLYLISNNVSILLRCNNFFNAYNLNAPVKI